MFTINVNDVDEFDVGAVTDSDAAANAVNENAANGTVVGVTALASDADATNNTITYTLDDNAGGRFAIDGSTGVVTVANGTLLDREVAASHNITVRATSQRRQFQHGRHDDQRQRRRRIRRRCGHRQRRHANAVNENAANGTVVGVTALASDADATNNTITYTLDDNAGGRFAIDGSTGVVTVANGTLLDRELAASHNITVRATSTDGSFNTAVMTINVNDVDEFDVGPVVDLDGSPNVVNVGAAAGSVVGITAFADDGDATNSAVSYSLVDNDSGRFAIDGTTGVVRLTGTVGNADGPARSITVRASSLDGSTRDATFVIAVNNVNQPPTLINNTWAVTEGATLLVDSSMLSASDPELADGLLTFVVSNITGGQFELLSSPGVAITSFTQAAVTGGQIVFVHDGGEFAPAFEVRVSDGSLSDGPRAATINFTNVNDAPAAVDEAYALNEGAP